MGGVFPLWTLAERERARRAAGGMMVAGAAQQAAAALIGQDLTDAELAGLVGAAQADPPGGQDLTASLGRLRGELGVTLGRAVLRGRVGRHVWEGVAFDDGTANVAQLLIPLLGADLRETYGDAKAASDALGVVDTQEVGASASLSYQSWSEAIWGWPLAAWAAGHGRGAALAAAAARD